MSQGGTATSLFGRSAVAFTSHTKRFLSSCIPLDTLLEGGLPSGHLLELSGPPGTTKDSELTGTLKGTDLVLDCRVDMQNMTSPASLHIELIDSHRRAGSNGFANRGMDSVHYLNIFTLPAFLVFLHNLPSFLAAHPSIRLIVLNSIWFPFQTTPDLTKSRRGALLFQVKQILARICSSHDVSSVITSQLSTKMLTPDGSSATYDTGSRGILVPQLGKPTDYLPPGRTYRVIIVPESRTTGILRLLSSPSRDNEGTAPEEPYEMVSPRHYLDCCCRRPCRMADQ
ncbi:hypothetical protein BC834DRAFT_823615 [Gloeopeniophorella convolvens]|nr:hypothetical protein BC834DRAFT_823615 [Gloeopeniophorella convolvens]